MDILTGLERLRRYLAASMPPGDDVNQRFRAGDHRGLLRDLGPEVQRLASSLEHEYQVARRGLPAGAGDALDQNERELRSFLRRAVTAVEERVSTFDRVSELLALPEAVRVACHDLDAIRGQVLRDIDARVLTDGERLVWDALEGTRLTGKEIARVTGQSEDVIRRHIAHIRAKGLPIKNKAGYSRPDAPPLT